MIGNQPLLSPLGEGGRYHMVFRGNGVEVSRCHQSMKGGGFRKLTASEGVDQVKQNPRTPTPLHLGGKSCPVPFCFILDSTSCLYRVDFNEMRERGFFHLSKISPLYREIHLFSVLTLPDILLVFSQSIKLNPPPYS